MRAAALALLLVPACSAGVAAPSRTGAAPTAAPAAVDIVNYAFAPKALTVKAGMTVTWTERDDDLAGKGAHTVSGEGFTSMPVAKGTTYAFTFAEPGTYAYLCGIHNYMTGTVTVEP
jgi:plastocyanin